MSGRYRVDGVQGAAQPGSDGEVLANRLGLAAADEIAEAALLLLGDLYTSVLVDELPQRVLTVADLFNWRRRWLGNVYDWAGQLRTVNVSKGGFMFANAALLQGLLATFQREYLQRYTPCVALDDMTLAEAIAICHVELILIHPFREGNGRLARLLADVMAVQAGRAPLDYSAWDADKPRYFAAIRTGQGGDYVPMRALVAQALGSDAD
ncbi:Fic/DOC family protein [Cognatilysobacter segetis]|uniref:Fic/DOC family protein n=1 Tax=Cognatilysobacter segetis TaxID=2492394 RepID=UPI00105D11DA|nr:Fic family protein [Lysobacter segetis]